MRVLKCLSVLCYVLGAIVCRADGQVTTFNRAGCVLQARAYIDPSRRASSRYDLMIVRSPKSSYRWDFTLDQQGDLSPYYYEDLSSNQSRLPYGKAQATVVRATLYQYDTLEERVTFHNLELQPPPSDAEAKRGFTPRFLLLKSPLTVTTPSGICITLPAQQETFGSLFSNFNGNANALFIKIETTPSQPKVILPLSPLYQKHRKPVSIQLACAAPDVMSSYQADNTYKVIAVLLPNLATVTHLDSLTLIVRQRVDLQTVPVALKIPISRPPLIQTTNVR